MESIDIGFLTFEEAKELPKLSEGAKAIDFYNRYKDDITNHFNNNISSCVDKETGRLRDSFSYYNYNFKNLSPAAMERLIKLIERDLKESGGYDKITIDSKYVGENEIRFYNGHWGF